jgi:hypothetical protein
LSTNKKITFYITQFLELWRKKSTRANTQKKHMNYFLNEKGRKSHIILGEVFLKQEEFKPIFFNEYLKRNKK